MSELVLAVDIGGTKIAGGLVTPEGAIRHRVQVATPQGGLEALLTQLHAVIDGLLTSSKASVQGISLAVPGIVNMAAGTAVVAANLPWRDTPLVELMTHRYDTKTILGNDADGAALAEKWFGAATKCHRFICITIGTGIGGGIVVDDRLLSGTTGSGCEIGHMIIEPAGPLCRCGSRGCLEALAAGPAIARRMEALSGLSLSAKEVIEAARDGDTLARTVLSETAGSLAVAITNLWRLFEPQMIVVGGGVAAAGKLLTQPLMTHLARISPQRPLPKHLIKISTIHRESSILAAAALFFESSKLGHAVEQPKSTKHHPTVEASATEVRKGEWP